MKTILTHGIALPILLGASCTAFAEDSLTFANGDITLSGGMGILSLHAEEIVYLDAGDPTMLSLLRWDSLAPVLTTRLDVVLPEGWTLRGDVQMSVGGDSYMDDHDWIDPLNYDFDGWSDRSQHANTQLEWYFNGSALVGQDVVLNDGMTFNVNAGLKYTYARWTAYGGDYVYSTTSGSPRDDVGSWPEDERSITYQQSFPAIIAGVDTSFERGGWTFDVSAHAGMTFLASDVDNHWRSTLYGPEGVRYEERFLSAPLVSLAGKATFAVSDNVNVFVGGSWEQIFTGRGDTDIFTEHDDAQLGSTLVDMAGANLGSVSITAGLTGTF